MQMFVINTMWGLFLKVTMLITGSKSSQSLKRVNCLKLVFVYLFIYIFSFKLKLVFVYLYFKYPLA